MQVSCPDPANIFLAILAKLRWGPAFVSSSSAAQSSESTAGVLSPILKSSISGSYEVRGLRIAVLSLAGW